MKKIKQIMRNKITTIVLVAFLSGLFPYLSSAQQLSDTLSIEEVVITATKTERRLEEIPGKADMINLKQIENLPAQKMDDLLRFVSGVNVTRNTGIYTIRPSVTIRGISGDEQGRTLVLMNGIPLNTSDEGGVNWNRIHPYNIQKVEIFKGPGSSLYGNNAMGGVINIITRKPVKPIEGMAGISYGTYTTYKPELYLGGQLNNGLTYSLSGFYQGSNGYNNIPDTLRPDPDYTVPRYLKEGSVSANLGYSFSDQLNVDIQYDFYKDKRGEGEKIQAPDGEFRNFLTHFSRARLFGTKDKWYYDLGLYFQREHYFRIDERMRGIDYSRFDVESDRDDFGVVFNTNYALSTSQQITGGFEIKNGSVDGGDYYQTSDDQVINRGSLRSLSLYLQDEMAFFAEKLRLIGSIRLDHVQFLNGKYLATGSGVDYWEQYSPELVNHTWNAISPRLAARFTISDNISTYASYSRGFRASILDDLCRSGWMWVGPKIANPQLGPEYLDNFEWGMNIRLFDQLILEPTVYHSIGSDFLYYVATPDSLFGRPVYRRENVTRVNITGIELDARYQLNPSFLVRANYTINRSEIGEFEENPELAGKQLKYTPAHRASAGLLWLNRYVNIGFNLLYKDQQYTDDANVNKIDPYTTADLQLSRHLFSDHLGITLSVQDLFDNEHMETAEYISPGKLINARISLRF
jgi:iron complex outermembrane receptor protein